MRTLTCPEPEGALFSACFCVSFSLVSSLDLPLRVDGQLSVPSVLYLPQFPHFWGCCGHSALLCQPHDTLRRSRCGHRGRRAESGSVPQEGQRNQGLRPRGSPQQTLALHVPPHCYYTLPPGLSSPHAKRPVLSHRFFACQRRGPQPSRVHEQGTSGFL